VAEALEDKRLLPAVSGDYTCFVYRWPKEYGLFFLKKALAHLSAWFYIPI